MEFKAGDLVRCVAGGHRNIRYGDEYVVLEDQKAGLVRVALPSGDRQSYFAERFELVTPAKPAAPPRPDPVEWLKRLVKDNHQNGAPYFARCMLEQCYGIAVSTKQVVEFTPINSAE